METCTVETGLLKKHACGQPAVTHCLNCEQALCSKHAVPEQTDTGRKTGKFLCKECAVAQKEHDKIAPPAPPPAAPAAAKPAAAPPAAAAAKPAAPAAQPAMAAKAAAPKEAPREEKKPDDDAPLEFTPSKK